MPRWGALCPVPQQSGVPNRQLLGHTTQTSISDCFSMASCNPAEIKLPLKPGVNCDVLAETARFALPAYRQQKLPFSLVTRSLLALLTTNPTILRHS